MTENQGKQDYLAIPPQQLTTKLPIASTMAGEGSREQVLQGAAEGAGAV